MGGTEEFDCILNVRRCRVYTVILYTLFYPARCDDASSTQTRQSVDAQGSKGAEETRLHSAHAGSMLPSTLWGKSPCHYAESANGRPRSPGLVAAVMPLVELLK